jgi:hypothetical protein
LVQFPERSPDDVLGLHIGNLNPVARRIAFSHGNMSSLGNLDCSIDSGVHGIEEFEKRVVWILEGLEMHTPYRIKLSRIADFFHSENHSCFGEL